jgi:riboflavin synthase
MFTGLIEAIGRVVSAVPRAGSIRLVVESPFGLGEIRPGDSVSVNGACLTVATVSGSRLEADVVRETVSRSTLGRLKPRDRVHLERALRFGERLHGHLVQGHVDGVLRVARVERRGGGCRLRIEIPPDLRRFVAEKGSISIDGVSLTVASVTSAAFEVALVPETLERTNLGNLRAGDRVNVEADLVARYLESLTRPGSPSGRPAGRGTRTGTRRP